MIKKISHIASNPVCHERIKHWNWMLLCSREVAVQEDFDWIYQFSIGRFFN